MSDDRIGPTVARKATTAAVLSENPIVNQIDGRRSYEVSIINESPTQPPPRVRKKLSNTDVQGGSPPQVRSSVLLAQEGASKVSQPLVKDSPSTKSARKRSLRNAVRKIFGRKSTGSSIGPPEIILPAGTDASIAPVSDVESGPDAHTRATPHHAYTTSVRPRGTGNDELMNTDIFLTKDTSALQTIPEQPPMDVLVNKFPPQRASSAPQKQLEPQFPRKGRSPYAVEFPQSAKLKPLDLANPFYTKEPRRRATLPSLIVDEKDAKELASNLRTRDDGTKPEQRRQAQTTEDPREHAIGVAVTTPTRRSQRKSRSADDLLRMVAGFHQPNERSQEIQSWRQSLVSSVTHHSERKSEERNLTTIHDSHDVSPISQPRSSGEHFTERTVTKKASGSKVDFPEEHSQVHDSPFASRPVTANPELTGGLEGRVARLESGMTNMQSALERLTAQSNRRTIIIDNNASVRESRQNSPSVLADNSQDWDKQYSRIDFAPDDRYKTREEPSDVTAHPLQAQSGSQPSPPRTYAALYSVINQERAARRLLEDQVRDLQQGLSDMHYQLSQPIIRRSAMLPQKPQSGVHHHLSQHYTPRSDPDLMRYSNMSYGNDTNVQKLTSRFSLSDSLTDSEAARLRESRDGANMEEETTKSFDLYQTPAEEQRAVPTAADLAIESEMF